MSATGSDTLPAEANQSEFCEPSSSRLDSYITEFHPRASAFIDDNAAPHARQDKCRLNICRQCDGRDLILSYTVRVFFRKEMMLSILRRWWSGRKIAPELKSRIDLETTDVARLKEMLARNTRMRKQTAEERLALPTSFGYARYPLSDEERKKIALEIEIREYRIRKLLDPNEPCPKYFTEGLLINVADWAPADFAADVSSCVIHCESKAAKMQIRQSAEESKSCRRLVHFAA
jgi:hypothetical protein